MARYKIEFDKDECIGCGVCASQCPENWEIIQLDGEPKAKPKKTQISENEYSSNSEAAEMCPVDAIKIEKIKDRRKIEDEFEDDLDV